MMIHYMTRDAKTRSVVAMALAVMLLAGCQEDMIKAPASGRLDMLPLEDYPQIAVQPGLQEALVFAPAVVEPSSPDSPMNVTVPVRSVHDKYSLNIQYRFEFRDDKDMQLRTNSGWRFAHLTPRIQTDLTGNSLETKAAGWRLLVRAAK